MSFFKFLSFFTILATIANSQIFHKNTSVIERFKNWVEVHKIEVNDGHHLAHMFERFLDNDKFIELNNAKNLSYSVGHNAYSGMDTDEFSEFMRFKTNAQMFSKENAFLRGSIPIILQQQQYNDFDFVSLPISIDWRLKGVVNNVRDQGQCGSCWSFSGTSAVETAVAIKTGKLYDLSEQQSVSCAGLKYGNLGCNGGMYNNLWNWDKSGICSENDYPYKSGTTTETGSCQTTCSPISETKVSSYINVTPYSDDAMMSALVIGSVSIAIQASSRSFQLYNDGIYTDLQDCGNDLDHAVILTGYGSNAGQDYYILRNSWGQDWGNGGYMLIGKGSQYKPNGMCGLLMEPMYPIV